MNAILKYPGSKWRISDWIISHFPPHKVYLEPYFGSGAVFFRKEPAYIETVNDIDGNIVNLFRVCRERPEELAKAINLTPFARDEFQYCYDPVSDPVEQARRTLVRYHQSFGTSNSSKNSWRNVQTYGGPRCATMWNNLPDIILSCCDRIKNAQIEHTDALTLIQRYNDPNTLIYCDPPYLQDLRKRNMYAHEMSDQNHIELLRALKDSRSMIVLSGYDNNLYNSELREWRTAEKLTTAQMGVHRTEKIWMNF
ncbi:MAG: DNA adenine methylase [Clostridia bacterium]|nr:DNA adenine methylase [Clostridia bacterium]